ncbi:MAG: translation elongation factor Ts [Eubacteriaceae bacterium]|nr:translation elongation factor Ts [Eubacteriaceae bacterium]
MTTAEQIRELREKTGAGMMDCKRALTESDGDMDKAIKWLREKGLASAGKKSSRITAEGTVGSYIHMNGKIGVLVEVNCETDFVARTDNFTAFVKNIAMQIAAANPSYVSREQVPETVLENEKEVFIAQAINEGKSQDIAEKMVAGRIEKFYKENCLLEQEYVKNTSQTVGDLLKETVSVIGENIIIRRFARYQMGEGLDKRSENFAEEIAKQISKVQ